jgi:hypothetical protein
MKIRYLIIIFVLTFSNVNAHNPSNDSLIVYIDNIYVGKRCCVDFNIIPSVLLENFYCKYLIDCSQINVSVNDPFSIITNLKTIKQISIEKNDRLSTDGIFHIRTKKAKDGYLLINETLSDKIKECCTNYNEIQISYVYNGKIVSTKDEVNQILKLRAKKIQILYVEQDGNTKVITISFSDK